MDNVDDWDGRNVRHFFQIFQFRPQGMIAVLNRVNIVASWQFPLKVSFFSVTKLNMVIIVNFADEEEGYRIPVSSHVAGDFIVEVGIVGQNKNLLDVVFLWDIILAIQATIITANINHAGLLSNK